MRRFAFALILGLFVFPLPLAVHAAEEDDGASERPAATLDSLFDDLRSQSNRGAARRVVRQIWEKWNDSGSATIDLLMGWANEAMRADKNAVAEDLLTQVIVLQPDYAEGWNRRATLFFSKGDLGRSLGDIERVLQLEPRHFGALSGLAAILQKTGEDRKALEVWKRVLAIYPANDQAQKAVIELEEEFAGRAI